jgi:glutamine amidotransferase
VAHDLLLDRMDFSVEHSGGAARVETRSGTTPAEHPLGPASTEVTVVNLGVGNLGAIPNMLKRLGATATITDDAGEIDRATKLVLPGVGAFDAAMSNLRRLGLTDVLTRQVLERRTPVLGLCLGMQLLADESEEGNEPGLGWIRGKVVRFRLDGSDPTLRIPQMGWNTVQPARQVPLLHDLGEDPRFYFAHSYHLVCADPSDVVGTTVHGYEFPSVVQRDNVMGAQFHPEKSHRFGMKLFENFVAL